MHSLSILIKNKAKELGFDACGIAEVASADTEALFFDRWIAEGCHAGMKYMENYRDIRLDPAGLVEGARSVISVALNYYPPQKQSPGSPRISYYAYGKDYHIVVKDKLRQLWEYITSLVPVLDTVIQFQGGDDLSEKEKGTFAGDDQVGILPDPAKAGFPGPVTLQDGSGVGEEAGGRKGGISLSPCLTRGRLSDRCPGTSRPPERKQVHLLPYNRA